MYLKYVFIIVVCTVSVALNAQTLFSYADKKVDVKEFTRAFAKLYPDGTADNKETAVREYLNLFINSKLKIHEAINKRYDTTTAFKEELKGLRQQLAENYLTDPESYNVLLDEAFVRSQKDIQVQHIFIPFNTINNTSDSAQAKQKTEEAYKQLISGKNFDDVALNFSADPSVKSNKGNIGFITVFSLPYSFENIIYGLSPGKFSKPFKSKSGYHLFKNISERKAVGKIKAAQILLAFSPGANAKDSSKYQQFADSLYKRISEGDDFAKLSTAFSNDYVSAASGGIIPEFTLGTYDPVFENAIISISADGEVAKPFLTSHGYHIVKRISITAPATEKDKTNLDELKLKLDKDARMSLTRELLINRVIMKAGIKQTELNITQLKEFADSVAEDKNPPAGNTIKKEMMFLKVGADIKNIEDFITFVQMNRILPDGSGVKAFDELMKEFKEISVLEYYKNHLEEYNESFRRQMIELKEGNLFFDIMMNEVWNKAQADTAGQLSFYKKNIKKYVWQQSADAVIFYCGDEETTVKLREAISKNPADWKKTIESFGDRTTVDSGRFELSKIPGLKITDPIGDMLTTVEKNNDDNSASFALLLNIYRTHAQKTFEEAKGDVINDFQAETDSRFISVLRKKYPVVINQTVLESVLK
jgi:peptidyl-prolyl cis-trans isomerase SurA